MKPNHKSLFLFATLLFVLLTSCRDEQPQKSYSFYHWKTTLSNSDTIKDRLTNSGSNKLYLRMFDLQVDQSSNAVFPTATVQFGETYTIPVDTVVPVIYIKNEVFQHTDSSPEKMQALVANVASKLKRLIASNINDKIISEIQIDCDWSDTTQDRYFLFLRMIRNNAEWNSIADNKLQLSCTVRWHQVKYRERTGVPPVDRGLIMAYNVGDLSNSEESNSIINNSTTQKYVSRLVDYPLEYDIALPLFEWIVQYRDGKLVGIHNQLEVALIESNSKTIAKTKNREVSTDFIDGDAYFYQGDLIRTETVKASDLEELARMIEDNSSREYGTIYYHINSPLAIKFTHEQLSTFAR